MVLHDEHTGDWPWTLEFRHRQGIRRVFFVVPNEQQASNGLSLLEEALGARANYFPPRGVHLVNELLMTEHQKDSSDIVLVCPVEWFEKIAGQKVPGCKQVQGQYCIPAGKDLDFLIGAIEAHSRITEKTR